MISGHPENEAVRKVQPDRRAFVCRFFALESFLEARLVELANRLLFFIKVRAKFRSITTKELVNGETTARIICWILFRVYVAPLRWFGRISNLLNVIRYKSMENLIFIVNITEYCGTIRPKHRRCSS